METSVSVEQDYTSAGSLAGLVVRRTPGLDTAELVEKMIALSSELAGSPLYPYQIEFARAILTAVLERMSEEISALFSRQSGKSQTLSAIGGALMILMPYFAQRFPDDDRFCYYDKKSDSYRSYKDGFWIGVFAPKREQAAIIFSRIKRFFQREVAVQVFSEAGVTFECNNGDRVRLSNGSFIKCSTASDQANIEGDTLHLGIEDEAQDISDEKSNKSISPMLAATGGTVVKIGTANARKSHFYNTIQRNIRREREGAGKWHFFVDWKTAAKYNTFYERYVRKEMTRLGETSDEFNMAYNCRFMLERSQAISEAIYANRTVISGPYSAPLLRRRRGMHYVAGVDFGKMHDSTVATILEVDWDNPRQTLEAYDEESGNISIPLYGKHVADWLELLGDDYEAQFVSLQKFLRPWGIERLALDYTGVGISLGDRAKASFPGCEVLLIPFSDDSKDRMGRQLLADIHGGFITWPGGPEAEPLQRYKAFKLQMLELEKEYRRGLLSLHHPDLRNAHDDYPDSLCLADEAASATPYAGEVEECEGNLHA